MGGALATEYNERVVSDDDIDRRAWMKTQPSYGPDWDAAIEFGIDVTRLQANLELTFEERLAQLEEMLRLAHELRPEGPVLGDQSAE